MTSPAPFDASLWAGAAYALVVCPDVVSIIRQPGDRDDAALRARVNAPPGSVVIREPGAELDTDLITWTCHVCGQERLDPQISVAQRPALFCGEIPDQKFGVRYCNDRESCTTVATTTPTWPPEDAVAGYCVPAQDLHGDPHRGCFLR